MEQVFQGPYHYAAEALGESVAKLYMLGASGLAWEHRVAEEHQNICPVDVPQVFPSELSHEGVLGGELLHIGESGALGVFIEPATGAVGPHDPELVSVALEFRFAAVASSQVILHTVPSGLPALPVLPGLPVLPVLHVGGIFGALLSEYPERDLSKTNSGESGGGSGSGGVGDGNTWL